MWQETGADGSLTYTFMDVLTSVMPYYWIRSIGGVIYLAGVLVFFYTIYKTAKPGDAVAQSA